jgi:hypothetical protein
MGPAADLDRHFHDLDASTGEAPDLGMAINAAPEVAVLDGRLHRRVDVDAVRKKIAAAHRPRQGADGLMT